MNHSHPFNLFAALTLLFSFLASPTVAKPLSGATIAPGDQAPGETHLAALTQGPIVGEPVTPGISLPARDLPATSATTATGEIPSRRNPQPDQLVENIIDALDPLAGSGANHGRTPGLLIDFEGVGNDANVSPPDTNGDVGPNHYVQMVNIQFGIFDKSGNLLVGPTPFNQLFLGQGGNCEAQNAGDPIVVYDPLADRWLLSQFASPSHMCIAISQTADPTGSYHLYEFNVGQFPDYFKFGVWPDGYYMSANESTYTAYAFDRVKMLQGQPATFQKFTGEDNLLLPSDLDGTTPPPEGAPNYFYTFKDDVFHGGSDRLEIFEFHVDWITPANTTFTLVNSIPITNFTYTVCGYFVFPCIPQGGTTQKVDAVSEWPMHRFPYRNFGDHQTLLGNFAIDMGGDRAGIRWFELRKTGANWTLYQEGTHDPDSNHHWMGSIAMDASGNIALGYSVSSTSMFPAIRYATRLASDPLGTLQAEQVLINGIGSQTSSSRWGDYSAMSVDPLDDCTFWYTNEYYPVSAPKAWHTRVGAFKLPECVSGTNLQIVKNADPDPLVYPGAALTYTLSITNTGPLSITLLPNTASNAAAIAINPYGAATPYPSTLSLTGLDGTVQRATATLYNLSHTYPEDVNVLLVGPSGQHVMLMSDAGGNVDAVNLTLTFEDDAPAPLPDGDVSLTSGNYQPTDYPDTSGDDAFPAPAPAGPYGTTLAVFNGTDPNGDWKLYIYDDTNGNAGDIAAGWSLTLYMQNEAVVRDTLPAGLSSVNLTAPANWTCNQDNLEVTCITDDLPVSTNQNILIYAFAPDTSGFITNTASITSTLSDPSEGDNISQAVTLVDTPPTITPDNYVTDEDTPLSGNVLDNDDDLDGDPLTATLDVSPTNGSLLFNPDGSFVYTPTLDFNGSDGFTYFGSDGYLTATASVSITVLPVNDAPVVSAGPDQEADEGQTVSFSGNYFDPGLKIQAEDIQWDFGDGAGASDTLTPTHIYQDNGAFAVTLTVTDTFGGVGSDTLLVNVTNIPPSLGTLPDQSVEVGQEVSFTATISDPGLLDSHTALIEWTAGVMETLNLVPGVTSFSASYTYPQAGNYTVTVTLTDKDGGSSMRTFIVYVSQGQPTLYLPLITR